MRPITSIVQFKRGDHVCIFYRDEESLVQTVAAYLAAGLRNGERCFCAQKPHVILQLMRALERQGFDTAYEAKRGALEIHTEDEVYFPAGRFEPAEIIAMLEESIQRAVHEGFTGFRSAGELSWALESHLSRSLPLCDQIIEYEALVERSFPQRRAIGLCQYPAHLFPPDVLRRVLEQHRAALEETMVSTSHSTLTLRSGDYLADIVTDRVNPGEAFHYVVQRRASNDVLNWGQESTIDDAIRACEGIFAGYSIPHSSNGNRA